MQCFQTKCIRKNQQNLVHSNKHMEVLCVCSWAFLELHSSLVSLFSFTSPLLSWRHLGLTLNTSCLRIVNRLPLHTVNANTSCILLVEGILLLFLSSVSVVLSSLWARLCICCMSRWTAWKGCFALVSDRLTSSSSLEFRDSSSFLCVLAFI